MRDCAYFEQLCSSSIDGTLTDEERLALDAHLAECPSCAALKHDLETMHALFSAEPEVPDTLHEQIMQRVEQEAKLRVVQPEKPARRMPVFTMVAAAAVVVMVVLGGGVGQLFGTGLTAASPAEGNTVTADAGAAPAGVAPDKIADAAKKAGLAEDTAGAVSPESEEQETSAAPQQFAVQSSDEPADHAASQDTARNTTQDTPALQIAPAAAGDGAAEPRLSAPAPDNSLVTANMTAAVTLPDSIAGRSVSQCYLAEGAGELPDLDGSLLVTDGAVSYFSIQNNMSLIEKTLAAIEKAGYTVSPYEDVGLVSDQQAETCLLIVVQN